jgi:hypothetical protein
MAKLSAENRSGELYRNRNNLLRTPRNLTKTERDLFRAILASKPADWFSPATAILLTRYVRTAGLAERLHAALDLAPIGSPEAALFLRQVMAANASLGTLANRMRLSQQVSISARSTGRMSERGSVVDELIGTKIRQLHGRSAG